MNTSKRQIVKTLFAACFAFIIVIFIPFLQKYPVTFSFVKFLLLIILLLFFYGEFIFINKTTYYDKIVKVFSWCGAIFILLYYFPVAYYIGYFLGKTPIIKKADAIFVFAAGIKENGELTNSAYQRIFYALNLYNKNLAKYLIFSGSQITVNKRYNEGKQIDKLLQALNIKKKNSIKILYEGYNTIQEVAAMKKIANKLGIKTVLAVTNGPHIKRVCKLLSKNGFKVFPAPVQNRYQIHLSRENYLEAFRYCVYEILANIKYKLLGYI